MREAIDLAIDRAGARRDRDGGHGPPATQLVTAGIFGYNESCRDSSPTSSARSQLLAEAGYPNGFKITFSFTNDRLPGDRAVGTSIAPDAGPHRHRRAGQRRSRRAVFSRPARAATTPRMSGWGTITGEAHYTLSALGTRTTRSQDGRLQLARLMNPELDKLMEQAATELDEAKRSALLEDASALFMKERLAAARRHLVRLGAAEGQGRHPEPRSDEDTLAHDIVPAKR